MWKWIVLAVVALVAVIGAVAYLNRLEILLRIAGSLGVPDVGPNRPVAGNRGLSVAQTSQPISQISSSSCWTMQASMISAVLAKASLTCRMSLNWHLRGTVHQRAGWARQLCAVPCSDPDRERRGPHWFRRDAGAG